jgi:hypothetical protein
MRMQDARKRLSTTSVISNNQNSCIRVSGALPERLQRHHEHVATLLVALELIITDCQPEFEKGAPAHNLYMCTLFVTL